MCLFCKQSIPEPRRTKPEIKLAEKDHAIAHGWEYFSCPKCKHEWSTEFVYEIYTEDGTALRELPKRLIQCGFTKVGEIVA